MWLQWSHRPQTRLVAERSCGGRKLCCTEALALDLFKVKLGSLGMYMYALFLLRDTLKSFDRFNVNALLMLQAISDGYT